MSLDTVCFSMYSDMSILIMAFSDPNMEMARAFDSSVLPTPVGPRNMNDPIGLSGSLSPTLARLTALEMEFTASSCPMTLSCRSSSRLSSFSDSLSVSFFTGTLVHLETTCAMSSSVTTSPDEPIDPLFHLFFELFRVFFSSFSRSRSLAAFS